MIRAAVATLLDCYPQIFLACHRSHVRDDRTKQVLSSHQARVLDHLDSVEPSRLDELAGHLGITPSSASLMIDRLECTGHVRRSRDSADARCVNIRLTKAGVRVRDQQKILDPNLVEAMLRRLPPHELQAALAGLRSLARAASELSSSGQVKSIRQGGAS
jgi:DNA-binding MarR family transcriptional regulator